LYACDDPRAFLLLKIYINEKKSWEQFVAFVRMNLFFFLEVGCISGFWGLNKVHGLEEDKGNLVYVFH